MTVVRFPQVRRRPAPKSVADDEKLAVNVRALYGRLCRAIDAAMLAGLEVQVSLNSDDRWGNPGKVRQRDIVVKRKL